MSKSYSVAEARAHLPEILDEVQAGKNVQFTRRGNPVAVLLSTQQYDALRSEFSSFSDAYKDFLARQEVEGIDLDRRFFDGLRDRSPARRVRL